MELLSKLLNKIYLRYRRIKADGIGHLYFKTLRIHKQRGGQFKKGAFVVIVTHSKCILACPYCPMYIYGRPQYPEISTVDEWKRWIERFPVWVNEFQFSGGEPSLFPGIAELANWLLDRGHHVLIYSNLARPEAFYPIKKSYRFVIYTTFHHSDRKDRYILSYMKLKDRFRVIPIELELPLQLSFTKYKPLFTSQELIDQNTFHFAPDTPRTGLIHLGCTNIYRKEYNK
jgi:organic radical activating enzyme